VTIRHVADERSLHEAQEHFLKRSVDGSLVHQFLGVDAEWNTIIPTKRQDGKASDEPVSDAEACGGQEDEISIKSGGSEGGASILQVLHLCFPSPLKIDSD
jgi:hypothetical protein